ncbi:hypothetical protein F2Q69_00009837 [Brassica cretica]|uniref:Uncharacterized protein n=1 Tax=Brassica cretica TaxID=69181 RepID=A0A8S9NYT5_BRACR|nr:hypothetical protein F2Q69_00009837 [Brassica cretica]
MDHDQLTVIYFKITVTVATTNGFISQDKLARVEFWCCSSAGGCFNIERLQTHERTDGLAAWHCLLQGLGISVPGRYLTLFHCLLLLLRDSARARVSTSQKAPPTITIHHPCRCLDEIIGADLITVLTTLADFIVANHELITDLAVPAFINVILA